MLASVSVGGADVVLLPAAAGVAAAAESASRAESALFSLFEQAPTNAAAQRAAIEVRRIVLCIGPPDGGGAGRTSYGIAAAQKADSVVLTEADSSVRCVTNAR